MTLTIEVLAGLANRIRAMISAICFAEDSGQSLHVIWPANDPACMARFQDLFQSGVPPWVSIDMGPLEGQSKEIQTDKDFLEWTEKSPNLPIKSHNAFYDNQSTRWIKYLRALKAVSSVQEKLNHPFLKEAEVVGVHIRRGDHKKARERSPTELFIEAMKKESLSTKFIVATDNAIVKKELEAQFGDRVWFPATSLTRMTRIGIQDALLDFLALSKCSKVLGSYESSFSELAALYGNVPLVVIKTS